MRSVADQEPAPVREARDDPAVHPELGGPGDVGGPEFSVEAGLDPGHDIVRGHRLHVFLEVLEADPATARERREQEQSLGTADDTRLVARERCRHRNVRDQEVSSVRGALERLVHRMARHAVRPAGPDDDARTYGLYPAVAVKELDEDLVSFPLHPGRRDPALDDPSERHEMSLENPLGLVLRQAALELARTIEAGVAHGAELDHARAVHPGTADVLGCIEEW